ncbi:hypothetical protein J1N35_020492 [Gossypium stocksii]|uniref:Uncharacterized protein n=1 Tax=Gossypium stocksii TaxID=47602 RepID=A0A9D3VDC6_9ROSI|nr:hypothetical protein J1N35_020492 [Gossypium stocksii]
MGGSWFLKLLLLSMLFILSFSQGITLFLFLVCCCFFVFLVFLSMYTLCFVFRCLGLSRKWMENNVEFQEYSVQLEVDFSLFPLILSSLLFSISGAKIGFFFL